MFFRIDYNYGSGTHHFDYFELKGKVFDYRKAAKIANKKIEEKFVRISYINIPKSVKIKEYDKNKKKLVAGGRQITVTKITQKIVDFKVLTCEHRGINEEV